MMEAEWGQLFVCEGTNYDSVRAVFFFVIVVIKIEFLLLLDYS